ncbi:MAG: TRAP transporter substrate-binding protein [Lachnospiraceae bacterium]|nr:TRAP transporter substrate-binding protein [Lachnospiraceae bacterium]
MKKKYLAAAMSLAMAVTALTPMMASADDTITLTYAEVNPLDSISGQMAQDFADKVEELSGGTIVIDIQASGVLGAEQDFLDDMMGGVGTIDIARISAFSLTSYGGEKSMLLSLPYTFESREHYWAFATSELAEEFLLEPSENGSGVRGLFYGEEGFRHFFTVNEISGIEDLAGLKLRVSSDPVMTGLVEGLGASATVVSFSELYSALQTGVVDGAEQPIANYQSNSFNEVAPYLILDGHTMGATEVIITDSTWDSLTEEQQEILIEAGEYAQEQNRANSESTEEEVLAELIESGVTVVEVEDLTAWQEAVSDVVSENIAGYEDLYQEILDLASAE